MNKYNININAVLVKPIYIGLLINIFVPVVLVGVAYYIEESGGLGTLPNESFDLIFWIFVGVAVVDGAVAILFKHKLFFQPMVKAKETFEDDFAKGFFAKSIVCYAFTTAISIYGVVIYLLGGTFNQMLLFVFISFVGFQLIRPRHGFAEKVLAAQERYVDEGRFFIPQK